MTENKGDLISREALKKALSEPLYRSTIKDFGEVIEYTHIMNTIDNAPTVEAYSIIDGLNNEIDDLSENLTWYINERNRLLKERRPQGKWFDCIAEGTLKARHGDYVLYKVNFLLDNLTREVYIMEGARKNER